VTIEGPDRAERDARPHVARRRRLPWVLALGAFVVVVGVVAALGGFREVPIERLPAIALGEAHEGNEYRTTVESVYLTDQLPNTGYPAEDGTEYLVVEATVENLSDVPGFTLTRKLIRVLVTGVIEPYGDGSEPAVSDPRFGDSAGYLQPGLPLTVLYSWEVKQGAIENGDEVVVGIFEHHFDTYNPAFDDYLTTDAVARVITEAGAGR
jgi:hypothetical protein